MSCATSRHITWILYQITVTCALCVLFYANFNALNKRSKVQRGVMEQIFIPVEKQEHFHYKKEAILIFQYKLV
jgi:hypothetical protein